MMPIEVELIYVGKYSTDISPIFTKLNMRLIVIRQIMALSQALFPLINGMK